MLRSIFESRKPASLFKSAIFGIEIVQQYNYLGTGLPPMRNFTLALEHLKEKAMFLQLMDLIEITHARFLTQS